MAKVIGVSLGLASPIAAITWRILYRGNHFVGWEIVPAAGGLFKLKTCTPLQVVGEAFWTSRHYQYFGVDSAISSLVPGLLNCAGVGVSSSQVIGLLMFAVTMLLISHALDLTGRKSVWVALAVGASPTLLTFSTGLPYGAVQALPLCVTFWMISSPRLRGAWLATLAIGLLTVEFSFHVYENGRTFFIPLALAALMDRSVPLKTRLAWITVATVQMSELIYLLYYVGQTCAVDKVNGIHLLLSAWPEALRVAFMTIFVKGELDAQVLPALGLLLVPFLRKHRGVLLFTLLFNWLLILILAAVVSVPELRPRRFVMLEFCNLIIIAAFIRDWLPKAKSEIRARIALGAVVAALVLGNVLQYREFWQYTRTPISERDRPLPYLCSYDFTIGPEPLKWADAILDFVKQGHSIVLIYDFDARVENRTNPVCIPERLYLSLGHEEFERSINIFSATQERYSKVPIHKPDELVPFMEKISQSGSRQWMVLKYHDKGSDAFNKKADLVLSAIRRKFRLEPYASFDAQWECFKIQPMETGTVAQVSAASAVDKPAEGGSDQVGLLDGAERSGDSRVPLLNTGFEDVSDGMPRDWAIESWQKDAKKCRFAVCREEKRAGKYSAQLVHRDLADSRWSQTVKVKPGACYELSGWVKTQNVPDRAGGAYLRFDAGASAMTEAVYGDSEWRLLRVVVRIPEGTGTVRVECRLGGYGSPTTGAAYFDDVTLRETVCPDNSR